MGLELQGLEGKRDSPRRDPHGQSARQVAIQSIASKNQKGEHGQSRDRDRSNETFQGGGSLSRIGAQKMLKLKDFSG